MKKIFFFLFVVVLHIHNVNSQTSTLTFTGGSSDCNPFFSNGCKSSHGSPRYGSYSGTNNVLQLEVYENITTEGVFVNYPFSRIYKYEIVTTAAWAAGAAGTIRIEAANGLTEQKNASCLGDPTPTGKDAQSIYSTTLSGGMSPFGPLNWSPNKNYSQLWIRSDYFSGYSMIVIKEVRITNLGKIDPTPPSVPGNLMATTIESNKITVAWNASTDNTGVKGYEIYKDGTKIGTTASTQYTLSGLNPCTNYLIEVRAYDDYENYSAKTSINIKTTSDIPADITVQTPINFAGSPSSEYTVQATNSIILQSGFSVDVPAGRSFVVKKVSGACD